MTDQSNMHPAVLLKRIITLEDGASRLEAKLDEAARRLIDVIEATGSGLHKRIDDLDSMRANIAARALQSILVSPTEPTTPPVIQAVRLADMLLDELAKDKGEA